MTRLLIANVKEHVKDVTEVVERREQDWRDANKDAAAYGVRNGVGRMSGRSAAKQQSGNAGNLSALRCRLPACP